ncbi:MAG: hypothetical protein HZA94_02150 [Candidatus Vogelbacteria bacterium]|nr:hypothetical protein [Candidatus Vogelbacteria bacterium]
MNNEVKEKIKKVPILGPILSKLYWVFYIDRHNKKQLLKNRGLKNVEHGKKCFIIATGPSVKTLDLKVLTGELCISVSNFFVHPDFNIIKPKYHIFVPLWPTVTEEQCILLFEDAEKYFPGGQNVLVAVTDRHIIEKNKLFLKQNIFYHYIGSNQLNAVSEIDFSKPIPEIQTSAQITIYLGLYLGCEKMYMLGCDHDWILHYGETRHFYDEKSSAASRAGFNEWKNTDLEITFMSYLNLWRIYKLIRVYAMSKGVSIYNSPTSLLDVFPKMTLEDFFSLK